MALNSLRAFFKVSQIGFSHSIKMFDVFHMSAGRRMFLCGFLYKNHIIRDMCIDDVVYFQTESGYG